MKKLFLTLILFFGLVARAFATPFLVCNPPPAEQQITSYEVYKDGILEGTYDGETLNYDLVGVTPGAYDWTAKAFNVWGGSAFSDPYVSPSVVGSPSNLNVVK